MGVFGAEFKAAAVLGAFLCGTVTLPAAAQQVSMASWGGTTGDTWRATFGAMFRAETNIPVTVTDVPTPEAAIRSQQGAPQFNAAVTAYFEAAALAEDGLIETFDPAEFPEINDVPKEYQLLDANGRLLGMPVYFHAYGIAINTQNVQPGEIKSWQDLADPKWQGQIALPRPVYASTYDLTAYSYARGGDEKNIDAGVKLWKEIVPNSMTVTASMAQFSSLLTQGEVSAGAHAAATIWTMKRNGVPNVDWVLPEAGALMLPYIVVVPKGAADQEAAKQWLKYVARAAPQVRAAEMAGYMPFNVNAVVPEETQNFYLGMSLNDFKARLIQPDWTYIAEHRDERVKIIEQATAGQ